MSGKKEHYDSLYANQAYNPYSRRDWIFRHYISSLFAYSGLKRGTSVLDIGCGSGFFSYLIRMCGMEVHGVDISETGIHAARSAYGHLGITFEAADIYNASFGQTFDCVFVRSCSLYNTDQFSVCEEPTRSLMRFLKPNGTFIFLYNTKCSEQQGSWRYHTLDDVDKHFSGFEGAEVFFSSKIDTFLLGKHSFNQVVTDINMFLSRTMGIGGDLICIINRKSADEPAPVEKTF